MKLLKLIIPRYPRKGSSLDESMETIAHNLRATAFWMAVMLVSVIAARLASQ